MVQSSSKLTNLASNSNNWMSSSRQSNALLLVASVVLLSYMHVLFLNTDPGLSGNVSSTRRLSDQPRLAVIQKAPTTTTKTTKLSQSEKNHRSTLSSTSSSPSSNFLDPPLVNRWQQRFTASKAAPNKNGGYIFFKHIRKAGGTAFKNYLLEALKFHDNENKGEEEPSKVYFTSQEFQPMAWDCPVNDPRWEDSLSFIVVRHPIERHMSEFFYHGPGEKFPIDRSQLYVNKKYTEEMSNFLQEHIIKWMQTTDNGIIGPHGSNPQQEFSPRNLFFYRHYTDNFQVRALGGCSTGECLLDSNNKNNGNPTIGMDLSFEEKMYMQDVFQEMTGSYISPNPKCAQPVNLPAKELNKELCPHGADVPCSYPSVGWGEIGPADLSRAILALDSFDAVMLTETVDDFDQQAFLADILGVPRNADFSIGHANSKLDIVDNNTEKNHFYRDLLEKLAPEASRLMWAENKLEINLYEHAVMFNERLTNQWKEEVQWEDIN